MLRVLLKARADKLGVASKLIASSADLDALAGEESPDVPALKGWRRQVFGDDALRMMAGELALVARPDGVELIEVSEAVQAVRSSSEARR
jgi:ribonuclease D